MRRRDIVRRENHLEPITRRDALPPTLKQVAISPAHSVVLVYRPHRLTNGGERVRPVCRARVPRGHRVSTNATLAVVYTASIRHASEICFTSPTTPQQCTRSVRWRKRWPIDSRPESLRFAIDSLISATSGAPAVVALAEQPAPRSGMRISSDSPDSCE